MRTRKQLERMGFEFTWAYSAYRVCVWAPGRVHLGTFDSRGAYQIPAAAREAIAEWEVTNA